jgi:hypothetical protein
MSLNRISLHITDAQKNAVQQAAIELSARAEVLFCFMLMPKTALLNGFSIREKRYDQTGK